MKKLYVLLLVAGMMFTTSLEAQGRREFGHSHRDKAPKKEKFQKDRKFKTRTGKFNANGQVDPAVGAPLDGGLLIILATAGGAYFVARKKKRNQQ